MDIEEHAEINAELIIHSEIGVKPEDRRWLKELLIQAYLAGSARAQQDYARHYGG
jgi:hypothetical protein